MGLHGDLSATGWTLIQPSACCADKEGARNERSGKEAPEQGDIDQQDVHHQGLAQLPDMMAMSPEAIMMDPEGMPYEQEAMPAPMEEELINFASPRGQSGLPSRQLASGPDIEIERHVDLDFVS